jgi:GAF domain-containing protein
MRGLTEEAEILTLVGRVLAEALAFGKAFAYVCEPETDTFRVARLVGLPGAGDEASGDLGGAVVLGELLRGALADATRVSASHFVDHRIHAWTAEELAVLSPDHLGERAEGEWHVLDRLYVPMSDHQGQLLGYLEVHDPVDCRLPTEDTVHQIEIFAGKAAADIELRRLQASAYPGGRQPKT